MVSMGNVMAGLVETRWRRYGKDRVYVKTVDGVDTGDVDLVAGCVVAAVAGFEVQLNDCLRRWTEQLAGVAAAPPVEALAALPEVPASRVVEVPVAEVPVAEAPVIVRLDAPVVERPVDDVAANVAGAAAWAKRVEVNAQAPVKNLVARLLGVKTDERAWRVGARGEEKVAAELARATTRLAPRSPTANSATYP